MSGPSDASASANAAARAWDERYAASELVWSAEPNALAAGLVRDLPPGKALDLAAGEGRMALWLAGLGWQVTALDFSVVGLEKGRTRAHSLGLSIEWQLADATSAELPKAAYDLVLILYLHLPRDVFRGVLDRSATAVAPGGHLLALGHDRDNLVRGVGGPQDPGLLWDTELLRPREGLEAVRLEQVERTAATGTAVDTLLLAQRPVALERPGRPTR